MCYKAISHVALSLSHTLGCTYLVAEHDLDLEEGVGHGLAVSVDGPGEILQRPLHVQSQGLLHHVVHLLHVLHPVGEDLPPVTMEHLGV